MQLVNNQVLLYYLYWKIVNFESYFIPNYNLPMGRLIIVVN